MNKENVDVRDRFATTASAYRKRNLHLRFVLVALGLVWCAVLFYRGPMILVVVTFAVLVIGAFLGRRMLPKLICPECKLDADCETVRFCPECGSDEIQKKGEDKYFLAWPRCHTCSKELSVGKGGRRYRISFCTRCGAYLDEQGL